ncbi:MAG TPA: efflux RND transporter permease subunit [Gammaproteobacteria bacterium]|nr:efflux RND transporter permease subunit [Gammaproteobacteria bacterium]
MRIARFSVGRPVFTSMMMLIAIALGLVSLAKLPIDLMPDVTYPTLSISTLYPNASPEVMEELITRPLERAVAAVPGVEEVSSISAEGSSQVSIRFTWGIDLDAAANDIRDRLDRIVASLPEEAERPQLRKFDPASFPILILGAASRLDPLELRRLIDEQLSFRLERLPGVAAVEVWGGHQREIQVRVLRERLQALGLPLDRVLQTLRDANLNVPTGSITEGTADVTLRAPGRFRSLDEIRNTVIARREGVAIYLHQIAEVADSHAEMTRLIRINGQPGVRLGVRKQSGSNTVAVAEAVLKEVARINADFPQVELTPVIDTAQYIRRSIDNLSQSVLYGGSLAVIVLLFFLRDLRSTAVVASAIPISVISTFALIYFGGFTLNLMTLGGLALGVGMMVDNAIVVLENITRRRDEEGASVEEAAVGGTEQVTAAVFASTLTTLSVFLPMAFLQGVSGQLFQQFAWVVGFSLLASLVVALTLVPMLASRIMRNPGAGGGGRLAEVGRRGFAWVEQVYGGLLEAALRHRLTVLIAAAVLFVGSLLLIPQVGGELMPASDESEVRVSLEMEPGTRLEVVDQRMRQVEAIVAEAVPETRASVVSVGASGFRAGAATGEIRLSLVPVAQRSRSSEQIAAALRPKLADIPGAVIRTRAGQGLFLLRMGSGGSDRLAVEIRGYDLRVLERLAAEVRRTLADVPGITDLSVSREAGAPEQVFRIDRERAADLGLSVAQIARTIQTAVAGSSAGQYRDAGEEYTILVRLKDAERLTLEEVLDLPLIADDGRQIPLRRVAQAEADTGPVQIERKNQQRIVMITGEIAGRDLLSVANDVRQRLADIPTPRNYETILAGDYEEQQKAFGELMLSLLLAIGLVYMILASLYESLRDPLIVMLSVPLAAVGVVATLYLTGTTFNMQSFIGIIMLVGIVVNNAILIVDQAGQLLREGRSVLEAVREAGRRRLRPILMTTLTTVLGLLPLALGIGEGAEAQAPMARAVIGGLASSTLITLVVIPVAYTLLHRERAA